MSDDGDVVGEGRQASTSTKTSTRTNGIRASAVEGAAVSVSEDGEPEALRSLDGTEGGAGRNVGKVAGVINPYDRVRKRNGRFDRIVLRQRIQAPVDQRLVHERPGGIM